MKIVFFGCTAFSEIILKELLKIEQITISAIFSIPAEFSISYSEEKVKNTNFADLSAYAHELNVPLYWVDADKGKRTTDYTDTLKEIKPDVILVMGWYYMVSKKIRDIATYGAWGIHASLLPNYAGGAPLVWAIIEGEKSSGVTLFQLSDGVDDGDIIAQEEFSIEKNDTIKEVYDKATRASIKILNDVFERGVNQLELRAQEKSKIKVYPQRSPIDGKIDWNWPAEKIHNFIRAQTKPYPGAWTIINNKKVILWDATIIENNY
jgi:methionyl-tRNA formyltransferase